MPPPKKAAKKTAKKSAKKAIGHNDKHHHASDLRRAYEHMGRIGVLQMVTKASATDVVAKLTALAQRAIKDGHNKDAADLLRASEHLSFAVLAGEVSGIARVSAELKDAITTQFDELTRRADEHWDEEAEHSSILNDLYQGARNAAAKAFKGRSYHQALEFARAAEALAHVQQHGPLELEAGRKDVRLKGV